MQPSNPGETDNSAQRNEDQGQRGDTEREGGGGFRRGRQSSQRRKEPETTVSPLFHEIKTKTMPLLRPPSVSQQ